MNMKPWEEEIEAEGARPAGKRIRLRDVVLPPSFASEGRVPYGVVVPIGGAFVPGRQDQVVLPRGYFARPVTVANTREERALLERAMQLVQDVGAQAAQVEPFAECIGGLARALFGGYYGEEVLARDILPMLPVSARTLEELALAALGSEPYELLVK